MFPIAPTTNCTEVAAESERSAALYHAVAERVERSVAGRTPAGQALGEYLRRSARIHQGVASIAAGKHMIGEHTMGAEAGRLTAAILLT